jgi:hypothetical protein
MHRPESSLSACSRGDGLWSVLILQEEGSTASKSKIALSVRGLVNWLQGLNRGFSLSGYLLDATRPKLLWFYKFCKRNRLNLNCLLRQSIEQFAA